MPNPTFPPFDSAFTRPFWDGVTAGELRLPRCTSCGAWQWYPLPGATHCPDGAVEWEAVPAVGTVFTFTVVRRPFLPGSTRDDVPVVTILVELDAAPGIRLVGALRDGIDPRVGMRVTAEFPDLGGRRGVLFTAMDHDAGESARGHDEEVGAHGA